MEKSQAELELDRDLAAASSAFDDEPVFKLQSVPGWEHERREGETSGHDTWVHESGARVTLFDSGSLYSTIADDIRTAEQARQLTPLFAMVAQELERREHASAG